MMSDKPIPFEKAQYALTDDTEVMLLKQHITKLNRKIEGLEKRTKAAHDYLSAVMPRLNSILKLLDNT